TRHARVSCFADRLPRSHMSSYSRQYLRSMGIQRKEPILMIKDYNESVPFQPVCIDNGPRHHGVNGTPLNRLNFNTPALHIGVECRMFLTAKEGDDASIGWPRQSTLHSSGGNHPGRRSGRSRAT